MLIYSGLSGYVKFFSVIPLPTNKCEKEDLHCASKVPGQSKLTFAKNTIIEACYSLHCCNKLLCNVYQGVLMLIDMLCEVTSWKISLHYNCSGPIF